MTNVRVSDDDWDNFIGAMIEPAPVDDVINSQGNLELFLTQWQMISDLKVWDLPHK